MLQRRPIKNVHIYVLKDPETGEVRYVGKTKLTLEQRLKQHLRRKTKDHKGCWVESLKTKNLIPVMESIERVSDETWVAREMYWIQYYKELDAKLVNSNDGGEGSHNPTAEVRAKMSAAQKGKKFSAEHRAKIASAAKNRSMSPESRAKLSAAAKNISAETSAKRTTALKGKVRTKEIRAKMSAAAKNRSPEHRANLAAAHKNRKRPSAKSNTKFSKFLPLLEILKRPNCES